MHSTNLVRFYPTPAKLGCGRTNTDCLDVSNGVCTGYFLLQDSASEVSYACERIFD